MPFGKRVLIRIILRELINEERSSVNNQGSIDYITLEKEQYDSFPWEFEVSNKVFQFYYARQKELSKMSGVQRALCYFFICEGLIDNGGFYSILLETQREFNDGYITVLADCGAKKSERILTQIDQIYRQFEHDFSRGVLPPELNDESVSFNQELSEKIDVLEETWFRLFEIRNQKVNAYLAENKDKLITHKER